MAWLWTPQARPGSIVLGLLWAALAAEVSVAAVIDSGRHATGFDSDFSDLGPDYPGYPGFPLEDQLAYERHENQAVANLYENVLDILQCRVSREPDARPRGGDEARLARQPVEDRNWKSPKGLGQVSGVSVDRSGRPVLFHRGDHIWEYDSFDANYQYTKPMEGPIDVNTVLTLNPESGRIEDAWGSGLFYLPHGIHVDPSGNYWLTDVALHQIFKFPKRESKPSGESGAQWEPSLVLGERFTPGSDARHFCQPTAVAVSPSGEVVVADGYCNDRLLVFDADARLLLQIPPFGNEDFLRLRVPHSLTILKRGDVCTADREHQRIVCFNLSRALESRRAAADDTTAPWFPLTVHRPGVCRIFGVASHDDTLYAVNGPTTPNNPVMGFTISPNDGRVLSTWAPTVNSFSNPHDIAACPNGTALYVSEIGPNVVWKFRLLSNWKM